uniref:Uncharacterized protein n=1 Tax=viral metagenome TaxID=1070528 RepID=A0A6M3L3S5_9ZZZZ
MKYLEVKGQFLLRVKEVKQTSKEVVCLCEGVKEAITFRKKKNRRYKLHKTRPFGWGI